MKATPGSIGLRICALAALLAGCGFEQNSAVFPPPQPAPPPLPRSFTQTVEVFQVSFDMVLVPGDEAKGIKTLFVGKHEVTWDEFMPWITARDIASTNEALKLRQARVRPSMLYGDITRGYGNQGYPALSMSRLSAELYCQWLSKQTARKYRLPTEKEWEHVCRLGRNGKEGEPLEVEAKRTAVFKDASWSEETGVFQPRPAGSKTPDAMGLFDVMGNIAEWVTDTGEVRVVRGGHFKSPREELGAAGRIVEAPDEWNPDYPSCPKSLWWFIDADWVGFRLVCEP